MQRVDVFHCSSGRISPYCCPHVRTQLGLLANRPYRRFPGVARASIDGMADNQELPTDVTHIHVLILFPTV
jgi:hypothetical protein